MRFACARQLARIEEFHYSHSQYIQPFREGAWSKNKAEVTGF